MHELDLILTITGGLLAAVIFGYLTQRLGLSPIVGYLVAGIAVGPFTPGFVANRGLAEQLAEIGVILLMFGVGLQFHLKELLAVRSVAIPGAVGQSLLATILGAIVGHSFGWSWAAGLVFGLALSVASTVVLVRILTDNRVLHTQTGHIAVGWLVVEDLFTVLVLVLMPAMFGPKTPEVGELLVSGGIALLKVGILIAVVLVGGSRVIPAILDRVSRSGSRELFTLTVLVLALGIAVGSAMVFEVSVALGAFVAGMAVGRSDFSLRAATDALPMRDAFAVLFFVSVGMLFDPRHLIEAPGLIAATLGVVLLGKSAVALAIVWLLRYPFRIALAVAVALAQVGEFSFILSDVGRKLGVLSTDASHTIVAVAIISITLNPLLFRAIAPLDAWIGRRPGLTRLLNGRASSRVELEAPPVVDPATRHSIRHRLVIVGYGPIGKTLARLLVENEMDVTVIEIDVDKVRAIRDAGMRAVLGDAAHRDTLENAGVKTSGSLIFSSSSLENGEEAIRNARSINPKIQILARANYMREIADLRRAGASRVFASEGEVALALVESVLRDLGATPDQIDRERDRVHAEMTHDA